MAQIKKINYFEAGVAEGRQFGWMIDYIIPELGVDNFHAYGFEPCIDVFKQLTRRFGNYRNVSLEAKAISTKNEIRKLYHGYKKGKYYSDANSLVENVFTNTNEYENVECILFSDWIKENVPDFKNSFNIWRTNMEGSEWDLFLDLKNSNLLKYVHIFCGSNTEEEMGRSAKFVNFIPEFKKIVQDNNIKLHSFVHVSEIDTLLKEIELKYFKKDDSVIKINKNPRKTIYTTIIGDYDELHDPVIITPGWDYICFTDNDKIKSSIWQIRKIKVDPNLSNALQCRKISIMFHKYLPGYDITVLVPGYSVVKINLDEFLDKCFSKEHRKKYDMVMMGHPHRRTVFEEAKFWKTHNKDPFNSIEKQINEYKKEGMPDIRVAACGFMIRELGNRRLERFCELWWEEVLKYSYQDQISFPFISWKYPLVNINWIKFNELSYFTNKNIHHKHLNHFISETNNGLVELCDFINSKDILVEVGSHFGKKTSIFLQFFTKVYAVDEWTTQEESDEFEKMRCFTNNIVKIKRIKDASKQINDNFADAVFINSSYIGEISSWLSKIKKGGFISGSDYNLPSIREIIIKKVGNPDRVFSDNSWIKKI